jgi:hypothetical protein
VKGASRACECGDQPFGDDVVDQARSRRDSIDVPLLSDINFPQSTAMYSGDHENSRQLFI